MRTVAVFRVRADIVETSPNVETMRIGVRM
jgi:hypothetical protein